MSDKESIANKEEYHNLRLKSRGFRYRLSRRGKEVALRLGKFKGKEFGSLLDIGTADALMLDFLTRRLNVSNAVGLDLNINLLKKNRNKKLRLVQGDALQLPFRDDSFDAVSAVAVIEHVPNPGVLLGEIRRVLKKDGIVVLTSPDPFWDSIAERTIYRSDVGGHIETFNLKTLRHYLVSSGFKVVNAEKFMLSPVGFPFENSIERFIKWLRLDFLLCNQVIVGKVTKSSLQ